MNFSNQENVPRLICLSGPDGVGKTTQALRLVHTLRSEGCRAEYIWLRFFHVLTIPILALMRIVGLTSVKGLDNGIVVGSHDLEDSPYLSRLYEVAQVLDMLLATAFMLKPQLLRGTSVVCDRFVVDALVDTMVSTGDHEFHKSILGKALLRAAPRLTQHIIITASPQVLVTRREEIMHDDNLGTRVELYSKVARDLGLSVVNAEIATEESIECDIRALVKGL